MAPPSTSRRALFFALYLSCASLILILLWLYGRHPLPEIPVMRFEPGTAIRPPQLKMPPTHGSKPAGSAAETAPGTATWSASARPTVRLRQGTYVGELVNKGSRFPQAIETFRGVPYAQSTAGENRFREALPLPRSNVAVEAIKFGDICPSSSRAPGFSFSEDCLNANIYRPKGGLKKLPVVVYVHGGAFNYGWGADRNMTYFVAYSKKPVIGISFNYRLGPLGFLPASLMAKAGALNLGLKDQQTFFQWVRENVEDFGGDPDDVTIMGLSAGAHSIGHHIMNYDASAAPFHKAILESGSTTSRAVFNPSHPRYEIQFREFLIAAGVAHVPEEDVLSTLRNLPIDTITTASLQLWDKYEPSVRWPFQPVIDGIGGCIRDLPIRSWADEKGTRLPLITGFNTNEGTSFIPKTAETNADFREFFQVLIPTFSDADILALEKLYPDPATNASSPYAKPAPEGCGKQWHRLDAAYAHYAYICPVIQTAHFMAQAGQPVYLYEYAARAQPFGAANHADEAPVVTHDMELIGSMPGLVAVSDAMHGFCSRFGASKNGNPNEDIDESEGDIAWPRFVSPFAADGTKQTGSGLGELLVFGLGNDERMGAGYSSPGVPAQVRSLSDDELVKCKFWWDRVELSEGLGREGGAQLTRSKL